MGSINVAEAPSFFSDASPAIGLGGTSSNIGIKFDISATTQLPPSNPGVYSFVQLVTGNTFSFRYSTGTAVRTCTTGLDKSYPYGLAPTNARSTNDSPGIEFLPTYSELVWTFNAAMYLMWTPDPAPGCTGSACVIP